jgi:hypothetical protein
MLRRNEFCWKVIEEKDFLEEYTTSNFIDTFKNMADSMSLHLRRFGLNEDNANTFMTLLNSEAMEKLRGHLSEQLVKDGKEPVHYCSGRFI